jgi:hypothetical protein
MCFFTVINNSFFITLQIDDTSGVWSDPFFYGLIFFSLMQSGFATLPDTVPNFDHSIVDPDLEN